VVDVVQRPKLLGGERGGEWCFEWIPGRIGPPLCDDVIDAWGDHVVVANYGGHAAPLADLRVITVARDAAIIEIRKILQHPFGMMAAVRSAHYQRARRCFPVVLLHCLGHVERELHEALP